MIRNDFVSNSSSCSFVVRNLKKFDEQLCNILKRIEIHFIKNDSSYSPELVDEVQKDHPNFTLEFDNEWINCENLDCKDVEFINKILNECDKFEVDFGIDDCGEYTAKASQIATIMECLYKCTIDDEDCEGFSYTPIKELLEKKEG